MSVFCHILQGNPGTDGIPGAKGSAVSIFSRSQTLLLYIVFD